MDDDLKECPLNSPIDYLFFTMFKNIEKEKIDKILNLCRFMHNLEADAISQVEELPHMSLQSFKLVLKRYRVNRSELKQFFVKSMNKRSKKESFDFESLLSLNEANAYERYQKFKLSEIGQRKSSYLNLLIELAFAIKTNNFLRIENLFEVLINQDIRRLSFDEGFTQNNLVILFRLLKDLNPEKINIEKLRMFKSLAFDIFKDESVEPVYGSVQELRQQLKSYLGRNYPYYYLKSIKQQITQKELMEYANQLLALVEEGKDYPIEVFIELLKILPRNKKLMEQVVESFGDFDKLKDFESFLILNLIENEVFRRYAVGNMTNVPKAKFQIYRKVYYQLLNNRKSSSFALAKLWEMGDKEILNIWQSAILLNQ